MASEVRAMNFQLKKLRKRQGFTQDDVAQAIGETKRVVGAWERQDTQIPFEKACDIADFLNCSLDELAGRPQYAGKFSDPRQAQLNADYEYMDDAGKIAAANAVRGIAAGIAREKTKAAGPDAGNVRTA